ncbi:nucleoside triphosphate pyrophosphohydrolase [Streptomyces oryzae]|uniref:Nucleoside triphosphate pyrophosphohydrolase n=1 Tax=Streptomyces oryzae TaxID=1434886 RepID=A0ABS3XK08_9ACTN|nr:nucleoside triphosphate pyrophosphohydrolase [Streptomyces oryzae]MBO8195748.1 nucleoside triphosphate pyrophosphohydrolase [Streptomyces oryzae]
MNEIPETGRIVLLTTTHRVAPGLLSWPAWEALRTADRVLCADPAHPQLPYVRDAGVKAEAGVELDARALVEECAQGGGRSIAVLATAEGEPALTDGLARLAGSGRVAMPELELLPGSYDLPGARLLDAVQVMDRIRRECPWSALRTHEDLLKYGVEEVYELIDAIERGDREELREELGDVLLQVVFHARIAQDDPEEPFGIDDVAATLVDKLVNRHPHVFGDDVAETAAEVETHWQRRKSLEKTERVSVTEGIPLGQPALSLAAKLAGRARAAGLDALPQTSEAGVGYALLALAAQAEHQGIDPEAALRAAAREYRDLIKEREQPREQRGR